MLNPTPDNRRVIYFDGMRGLAILLVGFGHIFVEVSVFKIGWVGLNLFFILSGFLITQRLYHHSNDDIYGYFKKFYIRRALRIMPLYFAVLVFYFVLLPPIYPNYNLYFSQVRHSQLWFWTFSSNWWMVIYGLPQSPDLFHFWSLAVEEQFYLCWPLLFLFLKPALYRVAFVLALIAGSVWFRVSQSTPLSTYLNTFTAAEPLLLGCFVCICVHAKILSRIFPTFVLLAISSAAGLCIILVNDSNLNIDNLPLLKYGYSFINILFLFCLVVCIAERRYSELMRSFFSMQWLVWLGKYSYGIYVFHWILLKVFAYKMENYLSHYKLNTAIIYLAPRFVVILVCLLLSYCSYHFYEQKFLKLKEYFA